MSQTPETSVVVVGAGPVGCTLTLLLAQRGIPVTMLESEPSLSIDLRASTFHPPTLDLLDRLGVTERLLPFGLIASTYQYRDRRTRSAAIFDLSLLTGATAHPYRLQCEQYKMTEVVYGMLRDYPSAQVHFNHSVEQIEQTSTGVTVHAETPEQGFRTFRCQYVVGADGANSRIRKATVTDFEGFTYPERFLVVSTPFDFSPVIPGLSGVNYVSDPTEWCVLLRTLTLWRVLIPTDPAAREADLLADGFIQDRLRRLAGVDASFEIVHRTLYRVHQRVARRWRIGRCLLAGDACHINNPLGGMGMNGGLHDAFNLGEKLVSILQGSGGDELLDRYERQRRGICVRFIQEHTIRNKKTMEEMDPKLQEQRQRELERIAADPGAARNFLLRNSMIQSLRDAEAIT